MTTSLSPRTLGIDAAPSSAPGPIPFSRLVRVEWAKATDTRAARWLLALVALSTAGMMLVPVLAPTSFDQTYASYLRVAALALTILLPVVAILMLTGEWSQRSVMTTFTQEPRRIRVLNAKLAASMVLGGGAAVFGGVVTAAGLGLAAASGRALEANLTVGAITGYLLFVLLNVLAGVALGALLQSSAVWFGRYVATSGSRLGRRHNPSRLTDSGRRSMRRTTPATGSTSMVSPVPTRSRRPRTPTTAGRPSSRARTAGWLRRPPSWVATAAAIGKTGPWPEWVTKATMTSPGSRSAAPLPSITHARPR